MSWLLLIDGYNVVSPIAAPRRPGTREADPNWLHDERMRLMHRLVDHLPGEIRRRTCVVFDAANPPRDRPHQFEFQQLTIRFAIDYPEADDLIEEMIAAHSAPKQLMVVSSDHRVQNAARRRGCQTFDSDPWLDDLLDRKLDIQRTAEKTVGSTTQQDGNTDSEPTACQPMSPEEVDQWLQDFGFHQS